MKITVGPHCFLILHQTAEEKDINLQLTIKTDFICSLYTDRHISENNFNICQMNIWSQGWHRLVKNNEKMKHHFTE